MSAQKDEPGHDDEHDDFDGEPATELSPGEPLTPGWVPLVGLALFAVGGIYFLSTMDDEGDAATGDKPAASAEVKPAGSANPSLGLTKEKAREVVKASRERKRRREEAGK